MSGLRYVCLYLAILSSILILSGSAYGFTVVSSCQTLGTADEYRLDRNIVSSVPNCLVISDNDTIVNGNGYTITMTVPGNAVRNMAYDRVTVKNLNIVYSGSSSGVYGIYAVGASPNWLNEMKIENNVINIKGDSNFGIYIGGSARIKSNKITMDGDHSSAVYLYKGNQNKLLNDNITTFGEDAVGVRMFATCCSIVSETNITTHGSKAYPIYVYGELDCGERINITFNRITSYEQYANGVYLHNATQANISQNKFYTYKSQAIYIMPDFDYNTRAYDHNIDTSNTEQGMPIYYIHGVTNPPPIEDILDIGQLYIADSNNVRLKNVRVLNDGVILANSRQVIIEDSFIDTKMQAVVPGVSMTYNSDHNTVQNSFINASGPASHGFLINGKSDHNTISGNRINGTIADYCSYNCRDTYGGYVYYSDHMNVSDNIIYTDDVGGYGLAFKYSYFNYVAGNEIHTSGVGASGVLMNYTYTSQFFNNTIYTDDDCVGLRMQLSYNNNLSSDTYNPLANYGYSLLNVQDKNKFGLKNFTDEMEIHFRDTGSRFNYKDNSYPEILFKTDVSVPVNISRSIGAFNPNLTLWNESANVVADMIYSYTGLYPDEDYILNVTRGATVTSSTLTTDSDGYIAFTENVDVFAEFMLYRAAVPPVFGPPVPPPGVIVNVYPDPVSSKGRVYFDVTCIDNGGGCDRTTIRSGSDSCVAVHDGVLPDVCDIGLDESCYTGLRLFEVDTVDFAGRHNTSVNGAFEIKKSDGCDCLMNDECLNGSCLNSYVCISQLEPLVLFLANGSLSDISLGSTGVMLIRIINPLDYYNIVDVSIFGDPTVIDPWVRFEGAADPDENVITVRIEPNSDVYVPISVFGGKVGNYELSVFAVSQINGLESYDRAIVNVVDTDSESISSDSPGLGFISVVIVVLMGAAFLKYRSYLD